MTPRMRLVTALLSCVLALVVIWTMLLMATDAKAVNASTNGPPSGGCAMAWEHPHSAGADWCRAHGWTIDVGRTGHGIVLSPHRVVRYLDMRRCESRPVIPCYSFNEEPELDVYITGTYPRHRLHWVWLPSPLVGHRQWQWVDQPLADALAEGGYPRAASRNWQACAVKFTVGPDRVKCPDGLHFTL